MQALDEGRRRTQLELKSKERTAPDHQQSLDVRSHVLSLREGEINSRLRDRETTIAALHLQLRELTLLLSKEQATRDTQARRLTTLEDQLLARRQPPKKSAARTPPSRNKKPTARCAGQLQLPKTTTGKRNAQKKRPPPKAKRR